MSPTAAESLIERDRIWTLGNYGNRELTIARAKGCRVWDPDGREFLDFLSGIGVNNVGHCNPKIVEAIRKQCDTLIHCSNVYITEPCTALAERLARASGMKKTLFQNSGTETTEAALKLARRWSIDARGAGHETIISFSGSFHGRTFGSMSVTWGKKVREGFGALPPGVRFATFNDLASVDSVWGDDVCAVLVETVQGEGGINPGTKEFLEGLRARCTQHNVLLMFDEIQCGMGRSGHPFAFQGSGVVPDVVLCAKALGGGLPIGALLVGEKPLDAFKQGMHGSTFGGNPVACAAGLAVCDIVFDPKFLEGVREKGAYLRSRLEDIRKDFPETVEAIRGVGLMMGMELKRPCADLIKLAIKNGLYVHCTAEKVVRLLPPLIVEKADIDEAVTKLRKAMEQFKELPVPAPAA